MENHKKIMTMNKYILLLICIVLSISLGKSQNIDLSHINCDHGHADHSKFDIRILGEDTLYFSQTREILQTSEPTQSEKPQELKLEKEITNSYFEPLVLPYITATVEKTKDVGEIPMQSSVSNGAVNYVVPIETYPASSNVNPSLSLSYSSLSGVGNAGMGWNLTGTSTIFITHGNYHFDERNAKPASLDKSSAYSLDGTRLIQTSISAKEIQYQTELGNIKVVNHAPSGKFYFDVYYPNGLKAVFGEISSTSPSVSYPLKRVEDNLGNYIDYTYSSSNNIHYLTDVKYGNIQKRIGAVKITYKTREDIRRTYLAGMEIKLEVI